MPHYQPIDLPIHMNSRYLTKETAYFLGGIIASGEFVESHGTKYVVAPARYNYGYATVSEIEKHFRHVEEIADTINAVTLMKDTIRQAGLDPGKFRLPGFGTFFECDECLDSVSDIIPTIHNALDVSEAVVIQCFMVGLFDGRCYLDINKSKNSVRYIAIDCSNEDAADFITTFMEDHGFNINYNIARDRKAGGPRRNNQIRIKNHVDFMHDIGLISDKRTAVLQSAYNNKYGSCTEVQHDDILSGLKTLEVS